MLSTELSTGLVLFCAALVVYCAMMYWWQLRLVRYVRDAVEHIEMQNKRSVTLSKLAEIETTLTELTDSYAALLTSHKKLRSRIGMREHRDKTGNEVVDTLPTTEAERLAYKARLRDRAKSTGYLR